jgi:glycyl-tRNA synthetase beta chain
MTTRDVLLELGTEELPPKQLQQLAKSLQEQLSEQLKDVMSANSETHVYAAPRRIAVLMKDIQAEQAEQTFERRGPAVAIAMGDDGKPSKALEGFARSCGITVNELTTVKTDKGEWYSYSGVKPGQNTLDLLPAMIKTAVKKIQTGKTMSWGNGEHAFVRPVHWVCALFGDVVIDVDLFGHKADRYSYGHRFHSPAKFAIASADAYEDLLEANHVMVDFAKRRQAIQIAADAEATLQGGHIEWDGSLLDEVTAIVEWPVVLAASFEENFLSVPKEALVSAMQGHQKTFPVCKENGELLPKFIFVANIESSNPTQVISGNEKVMHARLSDAAFFYEMDLKTPLADRQQGLKQVLFHNKLGTIYERTQRIKTLASTIVKQSQLSVDDAELTRAADLCKCDLMTDMVNEFTELQGTMGYYYAKENGEPIAVANAMREHYQPAFAGDAVPSAPLSLSLALADKLDLLCSIFSIGLKPTGSRDPFALRRAGNGVIRLLCENKLSLDIEGVITLASKPFAMDAKTLAEVKNFLIERFDHYYKKELGNRYGSSDLVNGTLDFYDYTQRLDAYQAWVKSESGSNCLAAISRLRKFVANHKKTTSINEKLFSEPAEKSLYDAYHKTRASVKMANTENNYPALLSGLEFLTQPIDQFFDDVLVMVDDEAVKHNRLALLCELYSDLIQAESGYKMAS